MAIQCPIGCFKQLNVTTLAGGSLSMVLTMYMGGVFLQQEQACETDQPSTCESMVGNPAEVFLEKRGDAYIAKAKSVAATDMKEFRPEFAFKYEPCSKRTGTVLMHQGTEVTNQWCQALGCNYKQCVQQKYECNRDDGTNLHTEPEIQCVAAELQSNMEPGRFAAFFLALFVSVLLCICSCLNVQFTTSVSAAEVKTVNILPSPKCNKMEA